MRLSLLLSLSLATTASLLLLLLILLLMFLRRCIVPCCRGDDDLEKRGPHLPSSRVTDEASADVDKGVVSAVRKFEWREIESLTGNFTASVIGEGGFSKVYLGRLPDSRLAAFKVLHSSERLYRAFLQERDVLLHATHPNIVELLGYSDDGDQGVLVFEYVSNGTLHEKLHCNGARTPLRPLSWSQRVSILFQIASVVDYLHDGCDLQIVHGDLTASNVLLDCRFNPKLCDFGFARMGFSAAVKPAAVGHMVGSPGYADPHYLRTGIISKKSDVYSFGVLILEMFTGIAAVGLDDEKMLTVVMRERGWDRLEEIVDPTLRTSFDAGELEVLGDIAGRCVGDRPGLRPSMGEILRIMRERVKL